MFEVEQDGLVGLTGPSVPSQEWRDVVDAEGQDQDDPFEPADSPLHGLGNDLRRRSGRGGLFGTRAGVVDFDGERHG
jgi:hypothetical protein